MWPKRTRNQPRNVEEAPTACFLGALRRQRPSTPAVPLATQLISSDEESVVDLAVATPTPPDISTLQATPAAPTNSQQRREEREPALKSADTLPSYEKCVDQAISHLTIGKNEELEREIEAAIEKISPALRELSLKIHADPELGNVEYHAHDLLTSYLAGLGFTVERHAYGMPTAFVAEFAVGTGGRRVGFCAEYDALPGLGHACGHNLIAVSGVAAAVAVKTALERDRVQGRIVLFGTPAEGGWMKFSSWFSDCFVREILLPNASTIIINHPPIRRNHRQDRSSPQKRFPEPVKDSIYISALAIDGITVDYYGRASHAAASFPIKKKIHRGINAVDAVVQAWNNISMLRQQIQPTNRIHGIITHGGDVANVIPAHASMAFLARSLRRFQLEELKPRIEACFCAAAEATGCGVKMEWRERGVTYGSAFIIIIS
ncbi:hypothetical protein BC938DRAFT_482601 [Jimgerdemannia flammicorona]|uniref:Peptidase M20 dimerisation domain-containing protein n=1 Tax=Jimgerdemannia flammicorona TaxID=994334 RepID=A0A433QDM9_9FUNG|nr:hypothetical protein BC938DRAFT_482601 [Jimgerdemannia flammicorona]